MDYGRMDSVNGNYTAENSHMAENNPAWAEQERRRAEERKRRRKEGWRRTGKRRLCGEPFHFSDGPARFMPFFIRSVCTKMLQELPTLFSSQEPLLILAYVPESQGFH